MSHSSALGREPDESYAEKVANDSYEWYRKAAVRSRRSYKVSEILLVLSTAAVPALVLIFPGSPVLAGVFGSVAVVITGLRAIFHWHENYLRFSRARELVEAERRLFYTSSPPYDDSDRQTTLVKAVTSIEQEEMGQWLRIAAIKSKQDEDS